VAAGFLLAEDVCLEEAEFSLTGSYLLIGGHVPLCWDEFMVEEAIFCLLGTLIG
jgi:hypothetical protein